MKRFSLLLALAISAQAQSLQWLPNSEPDLAGYNLYIFGPTNFIAPLPLTQTNYPVAALPDGSYDALLTAVNIDGNESLPAGPITWTNLPPSLTITLLSSPDLQTWMPVATNTVTTENRQQFFRYVLELDR